MEDVDEESVVARPARLTPLAAKKRAALESRLRRQVRQRSDAVYREEHSMKKKDRGLRPPWPWPHVC